MISFNLAPGSRCAIRAYARRNPWLDLRDLEQEAALAALTADHLWEARIVAIALSRFVAEQRCPVSLPKSKGESWQAASATRRAPLTVPTEAGGEYELPELAHVSAEHWEPMEERLDRERAHAEIRRILDAESEAARAVLLNEEKSSEVARRMVLSVRQVYDDTLRAKRALRASLCPEAA
jgi:hypothetical protein